MRKERVTTPEHALLYLTHCTLATVSNMAMLKSRKKGEYERQIGIAQEGVDWIKGFNISINPIERVYDVLALPTQSVKDWARKYER